MKHPVLVIAPAMFLLESRHIKFIYCTQQCTLSTSQHHMLGKEMSPPRSWYIEAARARKVVVCARRTFCMVAAIFVDVGLHGTLSQTQ